MHVDVIAPTQKYTYSHPIDGTPYEYKRMDDNSREIATTTWHNNRLITLTNPAEVAIQAGGVQPMRSERWIDPAGRMIISHRVCPENTEFLKIPASDIRDITDEACFTTWRIYKRCCEQTVAQSQEPQFVTDTQVSLPPSVAARQPVGVFA
eukprot:CAMPEP_0114224502 /NCGR_PEP_ID=MMETSP0058-20121206/144_1 /TAXON_ID=36894 /ORGANISM="Pyramimonas parkeae, CCMP726" /LENGTH=150 /DNA_ID=CAMNT_0001334987 /DNA_START=394 /DNA_END=846 /DNA_ORIENTATION=-